MTLYGIGKWGLIATGLLAFIYFTFLGIKKLMIINKSPSESGESQGKKRKLNITKASMLKVVIALLILGAFYWIFMRPTFVRKGCNAQALRYAREEFKKLYPTGQDGVFSRKDYDSSYSICLHKNGL